MGRHPVSLGHLRFMAIFYNGLIFTINSTIERRHLLAVRPMHFHASRHHSTGFVKIDGPVRATSSHTLQILTRIVNFDTIF